MLRSNSHETLSEKTPTSIELTQKVLVVGEPDVGKSALMNALVSNEFPERHKATIGAEFFLKNYNVHLTDASVTGLRLQCWDIGGTERGTKIARVYYKESNAIIFVADATDPKSIEALEEWHKGIRESSGKRDLPAIILINKMDMVNIEELQLIKESVDLVIKKMERGVHAPVVYYASVKENALYDVETQKINPEKNIESIFQSLAETIVQFHIAASKKPVNELSLNEFNGILAKHDSMASSGIFGIESAEMSKLKQLAKASDAERSPITKTEVQSAIMSAYGFFNSSRGYRTSLFLQGSEKLGISEKSRTDVRVFI